MSASPPDYRSPRVDAAADQYDRAYVDVPNWDIGRPQRAFVRLAEAGLIEGRVLDVGCGTGELSLYLARRGHAVLGIDFAPRAIAQARTKARWRRVDAHFLVWDALRLPALRERLGIQFDTVVDSAMLHTLGDAQRDQFVEGLATILRPGGRYFVLCDARPDGSPGSVPGLSRAEFRRRFREAAGWRIEFVEPTMFERRWSRNAAYIAGITRLPT